MVDAADDVFGGLCGVFRIDERNALVVLNVPNPELAVVALHRQAEGRADRK
ncbi:hypothetical protein D3C86_2228730 [compost metagenome]